MMTNKNLFSFHRIDYSINYYFFTSFFAVICGVAHFLLSSFLFLAHQFRRALMRQIDWKSRAADVRECITGRKSFGIENCRNRYEIKNDMGELRKKERR